MTDYKGPERRVANRVDTGGIPGQLQIDLESEVLQLSAGGMLVEMALPLPVGSEHGFTLSLEGHQLEVRGTVRNCQPLLTGEEPPNYRMGIQFVDLDEAGLALLSKFVDKRLQKD
jgi:hypothetical protein